MKTRTVKFSNGTIKNADLKIPAEAYSVIDAANLIRESYLEYMFRSGCGLMSDEVLVSSIGHANFFEGALGGYKTRLSAEVFARLEQTANSDVGMAVAVARFRDPKATQQAVYLRASKNEALDADTRSFLAEMAKHVDAA